MQDWRWALRSFLRPKKVLLYSTGKSTGVTSLKEGMIDPWCLRVRFSGYMIRRRIYGGSNPEDSEPGPLVLLSILLRWKTDDASINCNGSKGFLLHALVNTNRSEDSAATSSLIAGDVSMMKASSILGIVVESPETVESREQRENGSVMKIRATDVISSYITGCDYLYKVFGNLVKEARNNETKDLYLSHCSRIEEAFNGPKEILENKMQKIRNMKS
ncbi:hypothetical protein ACHAPC_000701 [Botrytis cinerea]